MRFHYDLTQASPVIRDTYIYNASDTGITAGAACAGVATNATEGNGGAILATATSCIDMLGVTCEAPSCLSVTATGAEKYAKMIVNPFAVYLTEVDTTNHGTNTSASTETVTCTFSANNLGGWIYEDGPSTDTAYGCIMKIGAVTSTTAVTNVTGAAYDDELKANTTSTTFILIPAKYVGGVSGGSIDLDSTLTKVDGKPAPTGAAVMSVENYINSSRFPLEPLTTDKHCGKLDKTAKFYQDIFFCDNLFNGSPTLP